MNLLAKVFSGGLPSVLKVVVGGGAGALIALSLVEKEPRAVIDTFRQWGAMPVMGMMMLAMIGSGFHLVVDQIVPAIRENASASQKLADAVGEIARKEDSEAYEQKVLLGHIGTTMEKVLERLELLESRGNARATGAGR